MFSFRLMATRLLCVIGFDKALLGLLAACHILSTQLYALGMRFLLRGRIRGLERYHDGLTTFPILCTPCVRRSTLREKLVLTTSRA